MLALVDLRLHRSVVLDQNDVGDDQEKRQIAIANRVPNIILMALYGVAIFAGAVSGYGSGLEAQRARLPIYAMAFLVAAIILLIQDLDRPSAGFIKLSQQPMLDTATSISGFPD